MHERRWLERVAVTFVAQIAGRDPAQLGVEQERDLVNGALVSSAHSTERRSDVDRAFHHEISRSVGGR